MNLPLLTGTEPDGAAVLAVLNPAIAEAAKVSEKADKAELDDLAAAKADIADLTALEEDVAEIAGRLPQFKGRPGEAPRLYTLVADVTDLGGDPAGLQPLADAVLARNSDGAVAVIDGQGIIAMIRPVGMELGRLYRPRVLVRRRTDSPDPLNDAVRAIIVWLDQSWNVLPGPSAFSVVHQWSNLLVASGVQSAPPALFARSDDPDIISAPSNARAAVLAVQAFGVEARTDVEVLDVEDVTATTTLDAISSSVAADVAALMSQDLPTRVSTLELTAEGQNSLIVETRGTALTTTVPGTVTSIELRGYVTAGDGNGGIFRRRVGALPPGAEGFTTADGAIWERADPTPAWMARVLGAAFSALSTNREAVAVGQAYRSGEFIAIRMD